MKNSESYISEADASFLGTKPGEIPMAASTFTPTVAVIQADTWCSPIVLAGAVEIFDFTEKYDAGRALKCPYGIGQYDEDRRGMYETPLFKQGRDPRTIHMGLDIAASAGTPVFAPTDGEIWGVAFLESAGDYGGTVILKTMAELKLDGELTRRSLYMLFGHLSKLSVEHCRARAVVETGELLGWLGEKNENGGWNPHLHWQLSWLEPLKVDLPGAVASSHRSIAKQIFPDPTNLLRVALGGWS